ncbi:hypothetical protein MLD38_026685 [Melastoma candidum]|uniref:Uncharacterized protein n=1 Tax=Melastoma candidum TaxID=119954 RepID=A0ACB9P2W0_9MYRT|nr:hypothetical protein MLD38_026685 [Melastoma candidum]
MAVEAKIVTADEEKKLPATIAEDGRGGPENHVLLVSFSAQGHINPMLRLGQRLASEGIHAMLAILSSRGLQMSLLNTESLVPSTGSNPACCMPCIIVSSTSSMCFPQ